MTYTLLNFLTLRMHLPEKLLTAIFNYHQYIVPASGQASQLPMVANAFSSLSPLQQNILIQYYSGGFTLRSLALATGIPFSRLNREYHRGLDKLRFAANPSYRADIERVRVKPVSPPGPFHLY